ncbi:MAG: phenylalanine--tRNA ligase subunit beta, partial [Hyphomicrobiales bacterium]|nr:phenylalanine--tRNA ligase subunit beta [Hyphomicrobiales bacterium]
MKFTLSWLKDHLDTEATLDEIVEALTMIGLEVEEVDDRAQYKPFTIAKVVSAEQHPDADRLRVLKVDKGDGNLIQVVCGAPNAKTGLIGAFAGPGTYVPGIDVTLSVGNIRGVESHGMMCSERELNMSDEHDGIIDLDKDAPVGQSFAQYAGLDDPVIEIGITPNRPDALSVAGIARDLEAYGLGKVKTTSIPEPAGKFDCPVEVKLQFEGESLCPAFGLRYVKGVKNRPSPKWMQRRLLAIGLRPISALVDITNYVTFDLGRPLHVFDADKVAGNLVVRRANSGEEVLALDGKTYKLGSDNCVIADDNGVESLAGVMGGEKSGCSDETVNVLVESALWEPLNIARTGRDLGIITDARYRFERGVDPLFMQPGLDHATNLVIELCGGTPSNAIIAGEVPVRNLEIDFPVSEVKRLTGIELSTTEIGDILNRLGFENKATDAGGNKETINVKVPSWRPDVEGKADLVEEVMRIHGINNIEPQPLATLNSIGKKILTTGQLRVQRAQRTLAARGMMEAVTWSFISKNLSDHFDGGSDELALANPISSDMSDMRPSLLPNLMNAAGRNADRGNGNVALFEVGGVFDNDEPEGQKRCAGGIRRGTAGLIGAGRNWQNNAGTVGVFDAKADALAVLEACGMDASNVQIVAGGPHWYHPGRSGTIQLGPKLILATFGEIHPLTLEAVDVSGPICGFEVWLDAIPQPRKKATKTKSPLIVSSLQAVRRDFSFVVEKNTQAAALVRAILN